MRRWAWLGLVAQAVFLASWLVAASWQGPRYSVLAHTISDMSAVTAPHGEFLVVVLTLCGAATMGFALRSVWPTLRTGGWRASTGAVLLTLSIVGLGDLLSPAERLACRMADPGCTPTQQLSNTGGQLDNAISSIGLLLLVIAAFFLAAAMRRTHGWQNWARPTRWTAVLITAFAVASVLTQDAGYTGLFERLVAVTGAVTLAVLAIGILRRTRGTS
ncbi:DUF998 domain-containing protein [Leekyejoonella antrihumi]|uniref:DUF998 domain-containing protein n=1 Tax=Leekyejoonella antrihumi TaxID=1660198 RepID=A0A563DXQ4_9MICO|nr:DUF998 domain-containing protein [Leekyejoonella antrihumi]